MRLKNYLPSEIELPKHCELHLSVTCFDDASAEVRHSCACRIQSFAFITEHGSLHDEAELSDGLSWLEHVQQPLSCFLLHVPEIGTQLCPVSLPQSLFSKTVQLVIMADAKMHITLPTRCDISLLCLKVKGTLSLMFDSLESFVQHMPRCVFVYHSLGSTGLMHLIAKLQEQNLRWDAFEYGPEQRVVVWRDGQEFLFEYLNTPGVTTFGRGLAKSVAHVWTASCAC